MQIKEQLRIRMEQLKVPVSEVAKRVGVSNQTVRFWLDGRNFPGKKHVPALERALSFKLDFSEGVTSEERETASSMMDRADIDLLLEIKRLPGEARVHMHRTIAAMNTHLEQTRETIRAEERQAILRALTTGAAAPAEPATPPAPMLKRRNR